LPNSRRICAEGTIALDCRQPICGVNHERLEYAVLTRRKLDLTWQALNVAEQRRVVMPLDVYIQAGAEWLKAGDNQGDQYVIRLDWISGFSEAD
jgi:hypothetical protein